MVKTKKKEDELLPQGKGMEDDKKKGKGRK